MTAEGPPPPRVRVTASRPPVRRGRRPPTDEIDAQTELGALYLRSLMRAQFRLAAVVLAVLGLIAGGLPLAFWLVPAVGRLSVLGLPLAWLLLAVLVYPLLAGLGWWFVRRAERNERAFSDMVGERR